MDDDAEVTLPVGEAVEKILDAMGVLEARQTALRQDVDRLTECFRLAHKALRVLAEAASAHDLALRARIGELPELPPTGKPN